MDPRSGQGLPEGDVTMLFSDIEGSTRLLQEIGELYGDVLAEHHKVLREVWPEHGGVEVHADGDSFLVVFLEARAAVRAATGAQERLAAHTWPHGGDLRVRMGIHTGNVQVRHDDYWGIDVHYAARLCGAAHGGQVLMSSTTHALVADVSADDLGEHALKDFPAARTLYHLNLPGRSSRDFPPPRTLESVRTNLPSMPARLIGRDSEIQTVRSRLAGDAHVLTITGVGGSGKTRLALAAGDLLLDSFPDGVFLVGLAPISDAGQVPIAIAHAVGAPIEGERDPETVLAQHLARRELLLILDNMEHLLGAAPLVSRLVEHAPGLRVLVTSQAPLRLQREAVLPLESLDTRAAVALFTDRAHAADPAFRLTDANSAAVGELCQRLDGLPLALELAAARIRLGGPERLLAALERGVDALGSGARDLPDRQRGLRAALDWTVSLLGDGERDLFAALSVFADAWTIEQLERMFGDELDVWEASAALMDFSLIRTRGDGRFTMAETVRVYAQEMLEQRGQADQCRARHAALFTEEAEAVFDQLMTDFNAQVARTVDLIREFSAAIGWAAGHDRALYRRLLAALGKPYHYAAHASAIRDGVMALAAADDGLDGTSVRLFVGQGQILATRGDYAAAVQATERATETARRLGDQRAEVLALVQTARWLSFPGSAGPDEPDAEELLALALTLPPVQEDRGLRNAVEAEIAISLFGAGRIEEAERMLREIAADPGRRDWSSIVAESYLADCALARRNYDEALVACMGTVRKMPLTQVHNVLLQFIAAVTALAGLGRDEEAVELLAAIRSIGEREGMEVPLGLYDDLPALIGLSQTRLGDARVEEAERRGRARELEDAYSWVLAMPVPETVA